MTRARYYALDSRWNKGCNRKEFAMCSTYKTSRSFRVLQGHHAAYRPLPLSFYRAALTHYWGELPLRHNAVCCHCCGGRTPRKLISRSLCRLRCRICLHSSLTTHVFSLAGGSDDTNRNAVTPPQRVLIVTEQADHAFILALREDLTRAAAELSQTSSPPSEHTPHRVTVDVQSKDLVSDFLALYTAPRLVLSVSTFAWWAAFLGQAHVFYPVVGALWPCPYMRASSLTNISEPSDKASRHDCCGDSASNDLDDDTSAPWQDLSLPATDCHRIVYADLRHLPRWEGGPSVPTLYD